MIHRDIKPKNLFLAKTVDGRPLVKVLDFGLAKTIGALGDVSLTATSAVFGSPQYMSPEQMRSAKDVDTRSDIWSIGVCLYELLTTRVPFDGAGLAEICAMVLKDPVEPPSKWAFGLPPDLDAIVVKCLAKDPGDRYQTVAELAVALEPWSASEGSANRILHVMQTVQKSDFPTIMNADFLAHGAPGPHGDDGPKTMDAWDSGERARPTMRRIAPVMMALGGFAALAAVGLGLAGIASFASHRSKTKTSSVSASQAPLAPTGVAVAPVTADGTASDAAAGTAGALVPGLIAVSPMPPVNATPNGTETAPPGTVEPAQPDATPAIVTAKPVPAPVAPPIVKSSPMPRPTTTVRPAAAGTAKPAASPKSSKPLGPMDRL
jgi:serine/threonine-protein kinase